MCNYSFARHVCFEQSNFKLSCLFIGKPASLFDTDNPDWAPSQKIGHSYSEVKPNSVERHTRLKDGAEKRARSESALALLQLQGEGQWKQNGDQMEHSTGVQCQTEVSGKYLEQLMHKNIRLKKELCNLKLAIDGFIGNDEKTLHFTGLQNWQLLCSPYEYLRD